MTAEKLTIRRGTRQQLRLRMLIDGPPKAGKSVTALRCAFALGQRIGVIEAGEKGSTEKYYGHEWDGHRLDFEIVQLADYSPDNYTAAIEMLERNGNDVIVIDGISPEWTGKNGTLQIADDKSSYMGGWKKATPLHDKFFETIVASPTHIIATVRSKVKYAPVKTDKGTFQPVKIGMAPITRETVPYEFDILVSVDSAHVARVTGSRCEAVDGLSVFKPGAEFMEPIVRWLTTGERVAAPVLSPGIEDEQLQRVAELLNQLGWTMDRVAKDLPKKYGKTEVGKLNRDQGGQLVQWMEGQLAMRTRNAQQQTAGMREVMANPPAANPGHPAPTHVPAAAGTNGQPAVVVPGPFLTDFQALAIKDLKARLETAGMTRDQYAKALSKYKGPDGQPVTSGKQLSPADAEDLIDRFIRKLEGGKQSTGTPPAAATNGTPSDTPAEPKSEATGAANTAAPGAP